jgi:energy-coupling factor transporter ATP-binding protein EcfA2
LLIKNKWLAMKKKILQQENVGYENDYDQEVLEINSDDQLDSTVKEIKHRITQGYKNIESEDSTVLVLGNTGVGKSTLVNYLAGAELVAVKKGFGKMLISVPKPISPKMKVSHKLVSETTVPNSWKDVDTNIVYRDCPGFGDNRGPKQDIPNAFFIQKSFELSKNTKIILVTTESSFIEGRGVDFANLIGSLSELFKDTKALSESLCLVVTKAGHDSEVEDVQGAIQEILDDQAELLSEKTSQKNILKYFSENPDHISLFKSPKTKGKVSDEDRKKILSMINKAKPLSSIEVNVSVSDKSKLYVNDLKDSINSDIYLKMSEFAKTLSDKAKSLVQNFSFDNFQNSLDVINQLHDLGKQASEISSYESKSKKEGITDFLSKSKIVPKDLLGNIKENIQYLEFCKQILPSEKNDYSVSFWLSPVKTAAAVINHQGGYIDSLHGRIKSTIFDSTGVLFSDFNLEIEKVFKNMVSKASSDPMGYLVLKKYVDTLESISSLLDVDNVSSDKINSVVTKDFIDSFGLKFKGWEKLVSNIYLMNLIDQDKSSGYMKHLKSEFSKMSLLSSYKDEVNSLSHSFSLKYKEYTDKFCQKVLSCFERGEIELAKNTKDVLDKTVKIISSEKNVDLIDLIVNLEKLSIGKTFMGKVLVELSVLNSLNEQGVKISLPDNSILVSKLEYLSNQSKNLYKSLSEKKVVEFTKSIEFFTKSTMLEIMKIYYSLQDNKDSTLKLDLLKYLKKIQSLSNNDKDFSKIIDHIKNIPIKDFNLPEFKKIQDIFEQVKYLEYPEKIISGDLTNFWNKELALLIETVESDVQKDVEMEEAKNAINVLSSNIDNNLKNILENNSNIKVFITKLEDLREDISKVIKASIGVDSKQFVDLIKSNIGYEFFKNRKAIIDKEFKKILNSEKLKIDKSMLSSWNELDNKIGDEIDWCNNLIDIYKNLIDPSFSEKYKSFQKEYKSVDKENFTKILAKISEDGDSFIYSPNKAAQLNEVVEGINQSNFSIKFGENKKLLSITGNIVKLSEIKSYINSKVKTIKIKSLGKVIFDSDLTVKGADVAIISPIWLVETNSTIDLSGLDALQHNTSKALNGHGYQLNRNGQKGKDGMPGNPGEDGGNFYGFGKIFVNLNKLFVDVSGGKGGNGQDGGDGSDGQDNNKHARKNDNYKSYDIEKFGVIKNYWYLKKNFVLKDYSFHYTKVKHCEGFPGGKGGDGGKGGSDGIGGKGGKVLLESFSGINKIVDFISKHGKKGIPGKGGKGGDGGKNSNDLDIYYGYAPSKKHLKEASYGRKNLENYGDNGKTPKEKVLPNKLSSDNVKNFSSIVLNIKKEYLELRSNNKKDKFYSKIQEAYLEDFFDSLGLNDKENSDMNLSGSSSRNEIEADSQFLS